MRTTLRLLVFFSLAVPAMLAQLKLPAIISDHMVLQQKQSDLIWGWDAPGTKVTVTFAGQSYSATAASDGKWSARLSPQSANATPQTLTIEGSSRQDIHDVLIGEVWMCSGQSNMGFTLAQDWNGDIESAASNLPGLRLIEAPLVGTQELQNDLKPEEKSHWRLADASTALHFSAIGFLYGRYLHEILHVPVGLINNAWGGSSAEAWVRRSTLEHDVRFKLLMENTSKQEATLQSEQGKADFERKMAQWRAATEKAKAEHTTPLPPRPENWLVEQHRAGNIFAGMVYPTLGYGIKGVIWYQGESNADRAYEYKSLFPFMIEQWRKEQGAGDFPFYWVQLANFKAEQPNPGDSAWAELREAQTQTMKLPNTGQAVIIDLGEGKDIHPRDKHDVAARLVRWALVKDYGMKIPYRSPEFKSIAIEGNKATVTLDMFGSSLRPFGVPEARGFAICGSDRVWHWAKGKIVGKEKVEVWSDEVPAPLAVRYAWADNPIANLFSNEGLPVTPFRTDTFPMTTEPKPKS